MTNQNLIPVEDFTEEQILQFAQSDYSGFINALTTGKLSIEQVEKAIMSLGDEFCNLDIEVRKDAIDYLWMGLTLRGEDDFTPTIRKIAKFAETLIQSAINDPKNKNVHGNVFEFEVETGHVMEPETISQNFTFAYSDSLLQWQVTNDRNLIVMNGEVDETVDELVAFFHVNFNSITTEFDLLNQLA